MKCFIYCIVLVFIRDSRINYLINWNKFLFLIRQIIAIRLYLTSWMRCFIFDHLILMAKCHINTRILEGIFFLLSTWRKIFIHFRVNLISSKVLVSLNHFSTLRKDVRCPSKVLKELQHLKPGIMKNIYAVLYQCMKLFYFFPWNIFLTYLDIIESVCNTWYSCRDQLYLKTFKLLFGNNAKIKLDVIELIYAI